MTNERVWLVHKRDNYQNCKDENGYPTRRNFPEVTIDEIRYSLAETDNPEWEAAKQAWLQFIQDWMKQKSGGIEDTGESYDTGGYTGAWGSEGRIAMLHQKELVLNADDTANMLASVGILRQIASVIDLNALASAGGFAQLLSAGVAGGRESLQQEVHIEAHFPNATDKNQIEDAFKDIVNLAAQYANRS